MNRYNAPPVSYPSGRSSFEACLLLLAWTCGLLALAGWRLMASSAIFIFSVAVAVLLFTGLAAFLRWSGTPNGQLSWDGQYWRWGVLSSHTVAQEQSITVTADFQTVLLVQIKNQSHSSQWLWLERKNAPDLWLDLRRALYSPPRDSMHDLELHRITDREGLMP